MRPAHPPKVETVTKGGLSGPLLPFKVEIVKNELFQDHHTLPKEKLLKKGVFQDHHTLSKWKLVK